MKLFFLFFFFSQFNILAQGWFWQNPYPIGNSLRSVHFISNNIGWAVGDFGTILKTIDGGENWFIQKRGIEKHYLCGVSFIDENNGLAVGYYYANLNYPFAAVIIKTIDGGETWETFTSDSLGGLYNIKMIDTNSGIAVGYQGTILRQLIEVLPGMITLFQQQIQYKL